MIIKNNFLKRIITAIFGIFIFLFLIKIGSIPFFLFILFISILLFNEYSSLLNKINIKCYKFLSILFIIFIEFLFFLQNNILININEINILNNIFPTIFTLFLILIISIPIFFSFFKKNIDLKTIFINILSNIFGICYIGWMFAHIILIREIHGENFTYILFIIIWILDTFAYIFGTKFGKHKFTIISPNKSVEGIFSGLFFATLFSIILHNFIFKINFISIIDSIIIALMLGIFGQFGDIFESLIKRLSKEKDSGNFLPGHGGFLDRFDSIIFAAPIYFYFLLIIKQKI